MYDVKSLLADSGYINDTSITGGRVGVYQFGHQTLWSNMKVHCLERQSKAMYFIHLNPAKSKIYITCLLVIGDIAFIHPVITKS
jgi:hypothetical protein